MMDHDNLVCFNKWMWMWSLSSTYAYPEKNIRNYNYFIPKDKLIELIELKKEFITKILKKELAGDK